MKIEKLIKSNKVSYGFLIIIGMIQIGIALFCGSQKIGFHVDEISTFGLSNNIESGWIDLPHGEEVSSDALEKFVSIPASEKVDYTCVWDNQAEDVHPPFYYVMIHTISSMFRGRFCVWGGIVYNIVLSLVITILLYFIGIRLLKEKYCALMLALLWAVSFGNLNQIIFIRMYMQLSLLMVATLLWHLKYFQKKRDWKFYTILCLLSVVGALTHYYFIVFLFFFCLAYGINMILANKWKEEFKYVTSLAVSGGVAIIIFPAILVHIFSGYRGKESFHNMANLSDLLGRLKWFFIIISRQLFAGLLVPILLLIVAAFGYDLYKKKEIKRILKIFYAEKQLTFFAITAISCLGYFILVAKSAVMIFDRYIMPIFPIVLILLFMIIEEVYTLLDKTKQYVVNALLVVIAVIGLFINQWDYLYQDSKARLDYAEENAVSPVVVITGYDWRMYAVYPELMKYDNLVVIKPDEISLLKEKDLDKYDDLIVYQLTNDIEGITAEAVENNIKQIVDIEENVNRYKEVYDDYIESNYTTVRIFELN